MDDRQPIAALSAADETAVRELVERYYPEILRYCCWQLVRGPGGTTADRALAEDAAQESFLKLIRYLGRRSFSGNARAFLYQIARNTCRDLQRAGRSSPLPLDEVEDRLPLKQDAIAAVETQVDIQSALSQMAEDTQELLRLRFGQELKLREIAEVLQLPLRTVQSRLRKALKELEQYLKEVTK